ncbi:hypothetical protein LTR70_008598 [Exophiala xenobiotica]|uniref:ACB domain-containing protein n=1 Tax=Lithohypha guttulata TaxID=1690604 RepID=A0ABR0K0H3_9EURO|nr:hypothetical protein LTR24_008307 [Lithohypha guttulata]KAK5311739.1 hypothetical protein LTR70_008598 [Exophiala xenobiotica]
MPDEIMNLERYRVFVHALATVRRLPRTGSSRPPPASRLRLYGLYKQSMEGDVLAILPRPTLPITSPDPNNANTNNTVHRYASRDLRTREAQAEIEKWDAWNACAGVGRTEAKRQYISTLIETMKEYASGTAESRELVSELEFVWNQIREQSGSEPDHNSGSSGSGDKESPSKKLEWAGMRLGRTQSAVNSMDFDSKRPSIGSSGGQLGGMGLSQSRQESATQKRLKRTESGLRVLSPVSQGDSASIVEPVDAEEEHRSGDEDGDLDTAPTSPRAQRNQQSTAANVLPPSDRDDPNSSLAAWQRNLDEHLHALKTEIAALREQLSANHLLSSSTYSVGAAYYTMSMRQRIVHRAKLFIRTYTAFFIKQLFVQFGMLALVLVWGRFQGDLRIEAWVKDASIRIKKKLQSVFGGVAFWLIDLLGRDGRLGFLGRVLRIH